MLLGGSPKGDPLLALLACFTCNCCMSRSKLIAVIHCWYFSHELTVELYVIAVGLTCHCCISRGKLITVIHCWPFSHELIVDLYVNALGFTCQCCVSRPSP